MWCFDSTHWGSRPFITRVNKGHTLLLIVGVLDLRHNREQCQHVIMELTTNVMKFAKVAATEAKTCPLGKVR